MISLAPLGSANNRHGSTECEASVSQHAHIEHLLKNTIDDVAAEWSLHETVLESSCPAARSLVIAVDGFMSNGCLRGNRLYWYFVKQFLTRSECEHLEEEWQAKNARDLSLAWLKDSLNKQSMSFIFQSVLLNWRLVKKHYSGEAAMANRALAKRFVNYLLGIADVQFHFPTPSEYESGVPVAELRSPVAFPASSRPQLRQTPVEYGQNATDEPEHAVAIAVACGSSVQDATQLSVTPTRARVSRRRRSLRSDSVARSICEVPLAPDFVETPPLMTSSPFISSAKDYDYVFDQMLHKGERGLVACGSLPLLRNSRLMNQDRSSHSPPPLTSSFPEHAYDELPDGRRCSESAAVYHESEASSMEKTAPNPFDVALKASISKAKLQAAARETEVKLNAPQPTPPVEFMPFGEVRLDMGEVVGLSIKVFREEVEKFEKFYQVYVHFGTGQPEKRFFVLSNRAVYLLSLQCNLVSARKTYITCAYLPLSDIDFIAVGADHEVLYIHVKKTGCMETDDGAEQGPCIMEVCTACTQLGRAVVEAVQTSYASYLNTALLVVTEPTQHLLITTDFLARELHMDKPKLDCYCLAQWRQTRTDCAMGENVAQRSGFLYHKLVKSSTWLPQSGDYKQSFFHLQGKKLYQFEDSTCKVGERVIPIQESVANVLECKGNEQSPHMFSMELNNGDRYDFICASGNDLHKWVALLNFALSTTDLNDEAVACIAIVSNGMVVVAQEGVNCAVDGFVRPLTRIPLQRVLSAVGVLANERYACVLNDGNNLDWIFLRSPDQVDRFLTTLQRLKVNRVSNEDGCSRLTALLNSMPRSGDLFFFSDAHSDDAFEL